MATQQLKEELQEACWVDQVLVPQENQGLAKRLHREKNITSRTHSTLANCSVTST